MARAKKTKINGITFDSKTEADYYLQLLAREQAGEIQNLTCQPEFSLYPKKKLRKRTIRPMKYTPDFSYYDGGQRHIVEVKGFARPEYMLRKKVFLHIYGDDLIFHEVKRKNKTFTDSIW